MGDAAGRSGVVAEDGFGLEVVVEAEFAPFPAASALAVAAEGGVVVEGVGDGHPAAAEAAGQGAGLVEVGGGDVGGQAVVGVVGEGDGVVEVVVGENGEDGAEDFLAGDGYVLVTFAKPVGLT